MTPNYSQIRAELESATASLAESAKKAAGALEQSDISEMLATALDAAAAYEAVGAFLGTARVMPPESVAIWAEDAARMRALAESMATVHSEMKSRLAALRS